MAQRIGIRGKAAPGAADTVLYRAPNGGYAVLWGLTVCNREVLANTFRIAHLNDNVAAGSVAVTDYLYYDVSQAANTSSELLRGFTLGSGEAIMVRGEDANVTFALSGIENDGA